MIVELQENEVYIQSKQVKYYNSEEYKGKYVVKIVFIDNEYINVNFKSESEVIDAMDRLMGAINGDK